MSKIELTIENVAITRAAAGPQTLEGFPFEALEVGQSFFVPNHAESGRARAVPLALAKATFPDRKFRKVKIEGGVRYGRIG